MSRLIPHLSLWVITAGAPSLVAAQDPVALRAGRLVDVIVEKSAGIRWC